MGVRTVLVYSCEHCDEKARIETGMMGGGGAPQGWYSITALGTQLWFDTWACVSAYAADQDAAAVAEVPVNA